MSNTFFSIQGFHLSPDRPNQLSRVALVHQRGNMQHETQTKMDGYKLDELQVSATLCCRKDVQDLIDLLKIHKECFTK